MINKTEYLKEKYLNDKKFHDIVERIRNGIVDGLFCLTDIKDAIKYLEFLIRYGLR